MSGGDKWNGKFTQWRGKLINISSWGKNELKRRKRRVIDERENQNRKKETTSCHYWFDMCSLSSLPMVHCCQRCANCFMHHRSPGRWAERQTETGMAEYIIAHLVYYHPSLRNVQNQTEIIALMLIRLWNMGIHLFCIGGALLVQNVSIRHNIHYRKKLSHKYVVCSVRVSNGGLKWEMGVSNRAITIVFPSCFFQYSHRFFLFK